MGDTYVLVSRDAARHGRGPCTLNI